MKLKKTSTQLVEEAQKEVKILTPQEAKDLLEKRNPKPLLFDIRDPRELEKTGTVKGAINMPRGVIEFWLDPESPYYKGYPLETPKIFFCKSNWRSAITVKFIQDQMGIDNISVIEGGFVNMIKEGVFKIELFKI